MAKMSQTVKEIIQIVVFLIVAGTLVVVFAIYPLGRAKVFLARTDIEEFNADSLPTNDISALADLPAQIDTFRVDTDGLTSLACAYLTPTPDSSRPDDSTGRAGLVILIHDEESDRTSMIPLAARLLEHDFSVCLYDQRASGFSSGLYHSDGEYEAADLTELVAYLGIRDRIVHPCVAVGWSAGADAALLAMDEEPRLEGVVAIDPYITTERWLDHLIAEHDMYWIPFRHTLLKFWYELRSGYAPAYRDIDNVPIPNRPALLLVDNDKLSDETLVRYLAASGDAGVKLSAKPGDFDQLAESITGFIGLIAATHISEP